MADAKRVVALLIVTPVPPEPILLPFPPEEVDRIKPGEDDDCCCCCCLIGVVDSDVVDGATRGGYGWILITI